MSEQTLLKPGLRRIFATGGVEFRPYDRFGTVVPDLEWFPMSKDEDTGSESYLIRFKPGASSLPHEHTYGEEFLVPEGDLEDCDGTVMCEGEFVSYAPGSKHYSVSPVGCVLLVFLRGANRRLAEI